MNRSRQETPGCRNAQPEGSPVPTLFPWDTPVFVPESAILRVLYRTQKQVPRTSVSAQQLVGVGLTVSCLERADSLDTIGLRFR